MIRESGECKALIENSNNQRKKIVSAISMRSSVRYILLFCILSTALHPNSGFLSASPSTRQHRRNAYRLALKATLDDKLTTAEPSDTNVKLSSSNDIIRSLKDSFISNIETALQEDSFVSLILQGPYKSKKKKALSFDEDTLRGCIRQVQFRRILIKKKEFLQVTFKYHGATDIAKNWPLEDSNRTGNWNDIRQSLWHILEPQSHQENSAKLAEQFVPLSEWGATDVAEAKNHLLGIQKGTLTTLDQEIILDIGHNTKKPRLKQKKLEALKEKESAPPVDNHDRVKQVPLDIYADFLQALGVTDHLGKPKRAMASKLRQCQKFVEIVANLVDRVSTISDPDTRISVQDLGCGRGYLTFSLHAYLQQRYDSVESLGVDLRPKLVQEINGIARSLGKEFETLQFQEGSIEDTLGSSLDENYNNRHSASSLDILIALHACDTATDDALWCGISRKANIIVVAPCCHKEVRPQLNAHMSNREVASSHPLAAMLQHNVYRERHSEMTTDSLRALLLELAGYQVQVFEFIGGEHTAKNVMITAVRAASAENQSIPLKKREKLRQRIHELASLNGIKHQKLAERMGPEFLAEHSRFLPQERRSAIPGSKKKKSRISPRQMPPL